MRLLRHPAHLVVAGFAAAVALGTLLLAPPLHAPGGRAASANSPTRRRNTVVEQGEVISISGVRSQVERFGEPD